VISGVGQALAGFVVDRCGRAAGAVRGAGCFVGARPGGFARPQGYGGLLLAAALAGLGNAPFHPVDFTILNKRVSMPRLGHAFSVHGISRQPGLGGGAGVPDRLTNGHGQLAHGVPCAALVRWGAGAAVVAA
jgi:FSR family fosmidomycin resistance protein-like MFS transporter